MNTFFQDEHKSTTFTTILALLLCMTGISYYYLQFDKASLQWVQLFANLFLLVSALGVTLRGKAVKDSNVMLVGIEFSLVGFFYFLSNLFNIIKITNVSAIVSSISSQVGTIVSLVLLFSLIDVLVLKRKLITNWLYVIVTIVLVILPAVLTLIAPMNEQLTNTWAKPLILITACVTGVYFLAGLAMSVWAIIQKKSEFFSWFLAIYTAIGILGAVYCIVNQNLAAGDFTKPMADLAAAFLLIGAVRVNYDANPRKDKKIVHKK